MTRPGAACGSLRRDHITKTVTLAGWVASTRDHGGPGHVLREASCGARPSDDLPALPRELQTQREILADLGIDGQVQLIGPVEHSQMVLYYQKADVVVVSSRYESFGLVILEALASGTPVASTPVGISPHVIEQGTNGYLAAAGDDHSMAEAISKTLVLAQQQDAEKIRQSVSSFTWSRAVTSLLDVYKTMLFNT